KPDAGLASFLENVRVEAARSAASERAQAEKTPDASKTTDYAQAVAKEGQAAGLKNPADTRRAVDLFAEAAGLFRSAIKNRSTDPNVLAAKANECLRLSDRTAAVDCAVQALQLDAGNSALKGVLTSAYRAALDQANSAYAKAKTAGADKLPDFRQ